MNQKNIFPGFNPAISKFFKDLEKNNNKIWFDANREFYINEIREPLKKFVTVMSGLFYENGLQYIADPRKSIFRINRDIRFSKNKNPYKDNLGVFFPYSLSQVIDSKPKSIGLYLHFERGSCFIAGGLHMPSPQNLKSIRNILLEEWEVLEKITKDKGFKKEFPEILTGETLNSTPRRFPKGHPAEKFLLLKEYTVFNYIDEKDFFSAKLPEMMLKKGKVLEPFVRYLLEGIE
ncbi:MAG: DUF2461 domain-containing protein [bacterium]